jgi:hypothetical protein
MIEEMERFEPRESLQNGHIMTLYSWGNPRYFPRLPRPVRRYFGDARCRRLSLAVATLGAPDAARAPWLERIE